MSAQTVTPIGPVRVLAVCIPWASAHVSTGRRDADKLVRVSRMLRSDREAGGPVRSADPHWCRRRLQPAGPLRRQPIRVYDRLLEVMDRWTLHTGGEVEHGPLIDHIASDFECAAVRTWAGNDASGRLSDHAGVVCTLRATDRE